MGEKPPTSSAKKMKLAPVPMGIRAAEIYAACPKTPKNLLFDDPEGGGIMMQEGGDPYNFHRALVESMIHLPPLSHRLSGWMNFRNHRAFVTTLGIEMGRNEPTFQASRLDAVHNLPDHMCRLVAELLAGFHSKALPFFLQNYLPTAAPDLSQAVESILNGFAVKGFTMYFIDNLQNLTRAELARAYSQGGSGPLLPLEKIPSEMLASSPISVQFSGNGQVLFSGFSAGALINFLQAPDAKHHYLCAHPYLVLMATIRHLVLFRSASKDPEPEQAGFAAKLWERFSPPPTPVPA